MAETALHRTSHRVDITASAGVVYGLVADAVRWPLFLAPTVHVEPLDLEGADQRLRLWALAHGEVTSWVTRRTLDPAARRIDFRQEIPAPPAQGVSGSWVVEELPEGSSRLTLHYVLPVPGERTTGATWLELAGEAELRALLENVKHLAERWTTLDELVVAVEDTLRVDGPAELAYDFLYRMDNWPGQLPWLTRLDLVEETPGIQRVRMDMVTDSGRTHTTEAVRVCFPHSGRIVYKLTEPSAATAAQAGEWSVEPDTTGLTVVARHQAVLSRRYGTDATGAADTDPTAVHRRVRQVLSRDSTAILRLAGRYAQGAVRRIAPKS
ncbi:SRPBCC family protein [Streptomyces sp. BPSDS2]|uniref:aromatase/cyclase n=1 Tax=Streptomyces sp. BPSDS2 TaxID=2571021 RepID=UPI0010C21E87|nr:SRPBCC family protein [Streptomyces sp. BPSDS2]